MQLTEQGRVMATCGFIYDPSAKILKGEGAECGPDVFKRRRDSVPEYIRKMMK